MVSDFRALVRLLVPQGALERSGCGGEAACLALTPRWKENGAPRRTATPASVWELPMRPPPTPPRPSRALRAARVAGLCALISLAVLGSATPVLADTAPGVSDLEEVITNIRNWIIGLLVALATLLLTVGGLRYVLAGGDPGEVGKAKDTLKFSALGFAVAILAPLLVEILRGFVGLS
ncbi:hypothetical protein GCM10027440_05710 [Nocardiopsis coralliicola]